MDIFTNQIGTTLTFNSQTEVVTGQATLHEQFSPDGTPQKARDTKITRSAASTNVALYARFKQAEKGSEALFRFDQITPRQAGDDTLKIEGKRFGDSGQKQDEVFFQFADATWCVTDIGMHRATIAAGSIKVEGEVWLIDAPHRFLIAKEDGGDRWLLIIDQLQAADFACIGTIISDSDFS